MKLTSIGVFVIGLAACVAVPSPAQTVNVVYNFTGGSDGATPLAGLVIDAAGNLYGTTSAGGRSSMEKWNRFSAGQAALTFALICSSVFSAALARCVGDSEAAGLAFSASVTMSSALENNRSSTLSECQFVSSPYGGPHGSGEKCVICCRSSLKSGGDGADC